MLRHSFRINKIIVFFTFFALLINCKNFAQNKRIIIEYDNTTSNEIEKEINLIYTDKFYLVFEKKFSDDLVEIFFNNKKDHRKITTDNTTGEAAVFSYNFDQFQNLTVFINKTKISLKNRDVLKYKYLYITTENNIIKLLFLIDQDIMLKHPHYVTQG